MKYKMFHINSVKYVKNFEIIQEIKTFKSE